MDKELNEIDKWKTLRLKLSKDYAYNNEWEEAIQLFSARLERKFFSPVQTIIDSQRLEGEGFSIVTVQCSLIEMLSAFRLGKIYNHKLKDESPAFEYKESRKMFTNFLKTVNIFKDIFWKQDGTEPPFSANDFYASVRCGLMHEARTKNNWFISATPKMLKVKTDLFFIQKRGEQKIIYRTILHYRLKNYLEVYQNELRTTNDEGIILRKYLARKMDHLFEIPINEEFDWWNE